MIRGFQVCFKNCLRATPNLLGQKFRAFQVLKILNFQANYPFQKIISNDIDQRRIPKAVIE